MREDLISGKLLIVIVNEHDMSHAQDAVKKGGATGGTRTSGRGFAGYAPASGDRGKTVPEGILFSVIRKNKEEILQSLLHASLETPDGMPGMALVLDVPSLMLSVNRHMAELSAKTTQNNKGNDTMKSGATLITGIINHGQADDIMAVAREAGAQGGTIINARGTGTAEDVKFFGISLAPEKEMLLIVADDGHRASILNAICDLPIFAEPGGGIVFTVALEEVYLLGRGGAVSL
jgi:Nitrogen regulatory protein PII